ncbi:23S rRNA pseudouridine1911/1915/1917 synthase [Clostridiales Family XIII bacterium PM5-7]
MTKFQYIVTKEDEGVPIKGLLRRKFSFSSRLMTKLKFQHLVFLNGDPVAGWITPKPGDVLSVALPEEKSDFPMEDIPIYPAYEDDDLLILNKQPGVTVHPTKGHPVHTIANGLMKYMKDTNQSFKIRFVNRLDMDTTGLLIVAKNSHAQDELTKQMKANTIEKRYMAMVNGLVAEDMFTIDLPIGRPDTDHVARAVMMEGGSPSITHVKVLERYPKGKGFSLVQLKLETGRTHQIRVHLAHLGHPLVGDYLYGGDNPLLFQRQALHAYQLSFFHPVSGEPITVTAEPPEDMKKLIETVSS